MHEKRGQVTLFIIIGIIIVVLVSVLYYYIAVSQTIEQEAEQTLEQPLDIFPIQSYVESCIQKVGKQALIWIGKHGGYYILPEQSILGRENKIPIYFKNDHSIMPNVHEIEEQLSLYMDEELFYCLKRFDEIKDLGFSIEQGYSYTAATISTDGVNFEVSLPLNITKGASATKLIRFSNTVHNIRFLQVHGFSEYIINEQLKDFHKICISCIVEQAQALDMQVTMYRNDNDSIEFRITDFNSQIDNVALKFAFANTYATYSCTNPPFDISEEELQEFMQECMEQQLQGVYELKLKPINDITIHPLEEFSYQVEAQGFDISFKDYSYLFDINETGIINFTAQPEDIGEHTVWISAADGLGDEAFTSFTINITEHEEII